GADPDGGALQHVGVLGHEQLDLEARDVLAPAPDAVAHAVDEGVPAVGVDLEGVARVEPAVAPGGGRLLRRLAVADVQRPRFGAADDHRADHAGGDGLVELVDEADLGPRVRQALPTAVLPRAVVPARGDRAADLGLAVAGGDLHPEAPLEVGHLRDHRSDD